MSDHHNRAPGSIPKIADRISAIAERRLAQITEAVGLEPGHFQRSQDRSVAGLDSPDDTILADQRRQLNQALTEFVDPLVRTRAVELFVALAAQK